MNKVSELYVSQALNHVLSGSKNWMCVEDPFLQIRSHFFVEVEIVDGVEGFVYSVVIR